VDSECCGSVPSVGGDRVSIAPQRALLQDVTITVPVHIGELEVATVNENGSGLNGRPFRACSLLELTTSTVDVRAATGSG
jgi:hypothetical protein